METPEKRCTKCGETKAISEFSIDRTTRAGRRPSCRTCAAIHAKAYRERPDVKIKLAAYYEANRAKRAASVKAWQEKNPSRVQAYRKTYRESHKAERAAYRKANRAKRIAEHNNRRVGPDGARMTAQAVRGAIAPAGGFCCYCNQQFENGHIDHTQPISRGGTNDYNNLVYICASCNNSKGSKTVLEFLLYRQAVSRRNPTL